MLTVSQVIRTKLDHGQEQETSFARLREVPSIPLRAGRHLTAWILWHTARRSTLTDLNPLVDASKPVADRLGPFFSEFRAAARDSVPTIRDLSAIIRRPGKDLTVVSYGLMHHFCVEAADRLSSEGIEVARREPEPTQNPPPMVPRCRPASRELPPSQRRRRR